MATSRNLFVALMLIAVSAVAGESRSGDRTLLSGPVPVPNIPFFPPGFLIPPFPIVPPITVGQIGVPGLTFPPFGVPLVGNNGACTDNSQCIPSLTCQGCNPCPGQTFKGRCRPPGAPRSCTGCPVAPPGVEGTPCTRDSQCGPSLQCASCGGGGCIAENLDNGRGGECKPESFRVLCACP